MTKGNVNVIINYQVKKRKEVKMVYLNRTKGELFDYYKPGFASKFETRKRAYITDNPCIEFLEGVQTYAKTKHKLETAIQKEMTARGYKRIISYDTKTEWYEVPKGTEISLKDFECCKGRKIYKL